MQHIDSALKAFPTHGGLFRRRFQALLEQDWDVEAEMTAYRWTIARPGSIESRYFEEGIEFLRDEYRSMI